MEIKGGRSELKVTLLTACLDGGISACTDALTAAERHTVKVVSDIIAALCYVEYTLSSVYC